MGFGVLVVRPAIRPWLGMYGWDVPARAASWSTCWSFWRTAARLMQAFGLAVSALASGLVGAGDQVVAYHDQPRLLARVRA